MKGLEKFIEPADVEVPKELWKFVFLVTHTSELEVIH
jgi:DNA/RNA endonuclease G (NUC1)